MKTSQIAALTLSLFGSAALALGQDYSQPGPYSAGYTEVTVQGSGGSTFGARLFYPATSPGQNAPFDGSGGPYPGISFGHGFLQAVEKYQSTLEHLATWGYISIATRTQGGLFPSHSQFAQDILFCLTYLENANADPESMLFGQVDVNAFGLSGHSMGGGASILAAASDGGERVRALAPLAAANTNPSSINAMPDVVVPVALIAGSEDSIVPTPSNSGAMYNNTAPPRALQVITGGFHCGFIDTNSFGCDSGSISRPVQLAITRGLLTRFFELYLRGNGEPWSSVWGPAALADGAVVHTFDSGITLEADELTFNAPAGTEVEAILTVSHGLPLAGGFGMYAEGDWDVTFLPQQTPIIAPGGETAEVMATISIPAGAVGEERTFLISAEADLDGGTRAYLELTVTATTLVGDLNGDGVVDLADLGILLAAWNSSPGDPNWNPVADINGDGVVDLSDLGLLLANWGMGR